MYIIIILALIAVISYAGYRIWFLAGKLADAQEYIEELELTNEYMYGRIASAYDTMKQIDTLGAFASEDEAGTTFQLLNEVITELKGQFDGETQEEK